MAERALAGRKLGLIGLGLMGRAMGRHLLRAGASLTVHNRTQSIADRYVAEHTGARFAASPRAVALEADTILINVTDAAAVEAVLLGLDGLLETLAPGKLVIDMGTTAPKATERFAAAVQKKGAAYIDAPVSGGVIGAEKASLTIMAGGSEGDLAKAMAILRCLGSQITHVGAVGAGQVAKTANQMIVGLTIGAVAEAFALARAAGVDPAKLRQALQGGFADSRILELHGQRMIDGAFQPGGKSVIQRKDIRQALDLASALGLRLPATLVNHRLWDEMVQKGWGELDHSALIKLYD